MSRSRRINSFFPDRPQSPIHTTRCRPDVPAASTPCLAWGEDLPRDATTRIHRRSRHLGCRDPMRTPPRRLAIAQPERFHLTQPAHVQPDRVEDENAPTPRRSRRSSSSTLSPASPTGGGTVASTPLSARHQTPGRALRPSRHEAPTSGTAEGGLLATAPARPSPPAPGPSADGSRGPVRRTTAGPGWSGAGAPNQRKRDQDREPGVGVPEPRPHAEAASLCPAVERPW